MHLFHIKMYYRIMLSPCDKDPQNLVMCQISFTCSKTLVVGRRFVGYIHIIWNILVFYLTSFFCPLSWSLLYLYNLVNGDNTYSNTDKSHSGFRFNFYFLQLEQSSCTGE